MRYVTKKDEELIKTINLMSNFPGRAERILAQLEANYRKNTDDPEAAFAYGLYTFLLTSRVKDSDIGSKNIEGIFDAFNDAIELAPDYWLAQMFKSVLLISLPEIMRDETELVQTLQAMIAEQEQAEAKDPYFIVPYILYADFKFSKGEAGIMELLLEAEQAVPQSPITMSALKEYFCMPFKDFLKRLVRSNEYEIGDQVQKLGRKYFPQEEMFTQDIRQGWL